MPKSTNVIDYPDIVYRVFRFYLKKILKDLIKKYILRKY